MVVASGVWHLDGVIKLLHDLEFTAPGALVRAAMVGVCYMLWNVSSVVMIVQGFREKSYGMPLLGLSAVLAVDLVALYGPFSGQSHLFYYKEDYLLLGVWALWTLMQGLVYAQFLMYGRSHGHSIPEMERYFYPIAIGLPVTMVVTFWTFVVYYQDYYVNEICPIAVLIMSGAYLNELRVRPDLRGLSVAVGWMLAIAQLLLYSAVVLGDMTDPYPDASFGYGFIYWIYIVTVIMNFTYAVLITRKRRALRQTAAGSLVPAEA